jgi:hypothetical protein
LFLAHGETDSPKKKSLPAKTADDELVPVVMISGFRR